MVGKQNILLHVVSENREARDVGIDFILNNLIHSIMRFCSGGQDNNIETKWSNVITAIYVYNFMSQNRSMCLNMCILIYWQSLEYFKALYLIKVYVSNEYITTLCKKQICPTSSSVITIKSVLGFTASTIYLKAEWGLHFSFEMQL